MSDPMPPTPAQPDRPDLPRKEVKATGAKSMKVPKGCVITVIVVFVLLILNGIRLGIEKQHTAEEGQQAARSAPATPRSGTTAQPVTPESVGHAGITVEVLKAGMSYLVGYEGGQRECTKVKNRGESWGHSWRQKFEDYALAIGITAPTDVNIYRSGFVVCLWPKPSASSTMSNLALCLKGRGRWLAYSRTRPSLAVQRMAGLSFTP